MGVQRSTLWICGTVFCLTVGIQLNDFRSAAQADPARDLEYTSRTAEEMRTSLDAQCRPYESRLSEGVDLQIDDLGTVTIEDSELYVVDGIQI